MLTTDQIACLTARLDDATLVLLWYSARIVAPDQPMTLTRKLDEHLVELLRQRRPFTRA